jgi:hypothetical protein
VIWSRRHHAAVLSGVLILACAVTSTASGAAADIVVSPAGDDTAAGTAAAPFRTLARSQRELRRLRQHTSGRTEPIVIELRGGRYELLEPWTLTPDDSGMPQSPTVFRAAAGEVPVISGGRVITGWQVHDDTTWTVTLPEVARGAWTFSQLWVNGQRRFVPRFPAAGYARIDRTLDVADSDAPLGRKRFGFAAGDVDPQWLGRSEVELVMFHNWTVSRMRLAAVDAEERIATFSSPTRSVTTGGLFGKGRRFLVEGVAEQLSSPGQFHLDHTTGKLTYLANDDESPENAVVVAPLLEKLLVCAGDLTGRKWVEHVWFEGLWFAHGNYTTPGNGQSYPQAEISLDGVVSIVGGRDLAMTQCAITHTGRYAIAFGPGCRRNRVESCEMVDLGGGGVLIGAAGGPEPWSMACLPAPGVEEAVTSHITVRDCTITGGGRLHPAAVGVWVGHASHNTIEHNTISDLYYTGVSVGWQWGYQPSRSQGNLVRWNHIYQIGQAVLSDMGGVYTLGISPETRVEFNTIHDVESFDYGGWGLYADQASSGIVMRSNLVYRTTTGGFHQHFGRDNLIANNILLDGRMRQVQRTRAEEHVSFTFENNIVAWAGEANLIGGNWEKNLIARRNLYWNATGPITFPGNRTLPDFQKQTGSEMESVVADPLFNDAARGDYRLRPESPALRIGFEPWDHTKSGRVTPLRLTATLPPVPRAFPRAGNQ